MQNIALDRGGVCLSDTYIPYDNKFWWQCGMGHVWDATYSDIKSHSTWCPICSVERSRKRDTVNIIKEMIKDSDIICLSNDEDYKNNHTNLRFKCNKCNHVFNRIPTIILYYKNYGCPECSRLYGELNPAWRGGISFEPYNPEFNEQLKKQIFNRDGGVCQLCHEIIWNGHAIHHIDYDKKNSAPINLILLCLHCHGITNHNRDVWRDTLQSYQIKRGK